MPDAAPSIFLARWKLQCGEAEQTMPRSVLRRKPTAARKHAMLLGGDEHRPGGLRESVPLRICVSLCVIVCCMFLCVIACRIACHMLSRGAFSVRCWFTAECRVLGGVS